jgi:Na+-transporting methylmalonyl-CoA/oxaloacetate decarboxylase gamma subunit
MNLLYIILLITSLFIFLELLLIIYCVNTMGKILKKINNITKIEISQSQINKSLIELFKS